MSDERRACRRFPVPEHRSPATVKVGRKKFQARLLDVSASGYRVLTLKSVRVQRGTRIRVETDSGESDCVVAYTTTEGESFLCIGAYRVRECPPARSGTARRRAGIRCSRGAPPVLLPGIVLGVIVLLACSYVAFDLSSLMASQKTNLSWIRQLAYRD
ncbi:MAG: PilZ domain-containing protein [Planctomycetes bacterium]|nr:PilZ domain-containing protein [Planctomycetota bacterium]